MLDPALHSRLEHQLASFRSWVAGADAQDFAWVLPLGNVPDVATLKVFQQRALTAIDTNTGPQFQCTVTPLATGAGAGGGVSPKPEARRARGRGGVDMTHS